MKAKDEYNASIEKSFNIKLTDQLENSAPVNLSLSSNTIQENQTFKGAIVGQFSASDPDGDNLTYSLVNDDAKAVLQAGGVRFETDSDKNYTITTSGISSNRTNPKRYSDTDLTIWVPKGFFADDAVDPVGKIVEEAVNAQNSVLYASGAGPLGFSYPGKIFYLGMVWFHLIEITNYLQYPRMES